MVEEYECKAIKEKQEIFREVFGGSMESNGEAF